MAKRRLRLYISVAAIGVAILPAITAFGQTQLGTGGISGLVIDESGALVSDAEVVATNASSGEARKTTTSKEGQFTIPVAHMHLVWMGGREWSIWNEYFS